MRNHRSLKRERGGWGSARSYSCPISRRDLVRSNALLATHLADLQPLARASGFYDTSSFFHVRSGAAGGGAKLKLQRRGNHGESEIDGAVTVRERDLITDRIPIDFVNQSASRSPGHIISWVCRIPLPYGHGSVRVAGEDHRKGNPSFLSCTIRRSRWRCQAETSFGRLGWKKNVTQ